MAGAVATKVAVLLVGAAARGSAAPDSELMQVSLSANASAATACTVCPDHRVFNECPGNNMANCASASSRNMGCEWCAAKNECRVKCTCNDDSSPHYSLFDSCNYDMATSPWTPTSTVSYWPPVLSAPYSSYYPECECPSSGLDDPHMTNMHGERFDLMQPGVHVLVRVPRGAGPEEALLRVDAEARHLGAQCEDMYFTAVNFTGAWVAGAPGTGGKGVRFFAEENNDPSKNGWWHFQKVELKVSHGRTQSGLAYLNFYARHLRNAGHAVGGLLGEDDHTEAAAPSPSCAKVMTLFSSSGAGGGFSGSEADASL